MIFSKLDPGLTASIFTAAGTVAGATGTILYNLWRAWRHTKQEDEHSEQMLHHNQRKMIESLSNQVSSLSNQVAELNTQLSYQREYYESRIEEMRCGFHLDYDQMRNEINAMKRNCKEHGVCFEGIQNEKHSQS